MAPIRRSATGEAGYTLVELLVVVAIIGLLLAMTPALLRTAIPGQQTLSAARTLAMDLRAARNAALTQGIETRVSFDTERQSYLLQPGANARRLPYGVPFAAAKDGVEIDFFPDGSARGGIITVGRRYRVSADWLTGRVSIQ